MKPWPYPAAAWLRDRLGASSLKKDGDNHLHLWKLPPLDTLHSGGALASANDDLNNLAAIDPELAKLKSEVES